MPRTKGAKNEPREINVDEKIIAVKAELDEMKKAIAEKKKELKRLEKAKIEADKAAEAKKEEEEKEKMIEVIKKHGMTYRDIIDLLGEAKENTVD